MVLFLLANFYAKQVDTLPKSSLYCERIIELYTEEPLFEYGVSGSKIAKTKLVYLKDNVYLVETLNLLCDISILSKGEY